VLAGFGLHGSPSLELLTGPQRSVGPARVTTFLSMVDLMVWTDPDPSATLGSRDGARRGSRSVYNVQLADLSSRRLTEPQANKKGPGWPTR
jgi:hypothetical protein